MSQRIPQKPKRRPADFRSDPCGDVFTCRSCGWPVGPADAGTVCGVLHSTRVAADDNPSLLMSLAVKPLASPPFPLHRLEKLI